MAEDRVSKELLEAAYVYIAKHDLLLRVGPCETPLGLIEMAYQSDPLAAKVETIKFRARARQRATAIHGLARVIVLSRGLARLAASPNKWLCQQHKKVVCDGSGACVPLGTGVPGEYTLLWGVQEPAVDATVNVDVEEDQTEGYEMCPLASIHSVLEKIHRQDVNADPTPPDDGWWRGGIMERMSQSTARAAYTAALENHTARASTGSPLRFVWDMVTAEAQFASLKYVLDAAWRPPLRDCADFERKYGISRHLRFTRASRRAPFVMDVFEGVY